MQALIEDNIDVKGIHFLLNKTRRVLETCWIDILKLAYDKGHGITYKLSNEDLMTWVRLRDVDVGKMQSILFVATTFQSYIQQRTPFLCNKIPEGP